ncbi:MAG: M24 family metallopeptidase [Deltaproteobacteria bacterium]|nr:M24 family metallopeptidase [Kofleriaceae bacterium]
MVHAGGAEAQPGPVDPYAEPAKPEGKKAEGKKAEGKTEKGKGKGKGKAEEKTAAPVDPYAAGDPLLERRPGGGAVVPPTLPTGTGAAGVAVTEVEPQGRFDLAAVQGLLAVQNLDGWLIVDHAGQNPVARSLVAVQGNASRRWFYLVPRTGEPTVLCHASEVASFANVPGMKITYTGYRDLDKILRAMLKGKKSLAMEYSPKGALPSLSRVDAGTVELVRAAGVKVRSSDGLVQFAKATWGPEGRKQHYIAVHHLVELRKDALAFIGNKLAAGSRVTEREVQQRIEKGMAMRGLVGPAPVVAFGKNSADPDYVPGPARSATLAQGDVVLLSLAGKIDGGVYAAHSWVAVADSAVSPSLQVAFETAARARDEALAFVRDRVKRRRAVKGWEVDKAARDTVTRAGMHDRLLHRTGHSLDGDLYGSGTDLDDTEVKDQRALVVGTGFTVGPGVYAAGELGVRAEVSAYLGKDGLEVTTPVQESVETLVKR